jgi:hypothetical protein
MSDRAREKSSGNLVTWRVLEDGSVEVAKGRLRLVMHQATFRQRYETLGARGGYPSGQYGDEDEGEIALGIAADPKARKVRLDFGKSVAWLALDPEQADAFADALREKARLARGEGECPNEV